MNRFRSTRHYGFAIILASIVLSAASSSASQGVKPAHAEKDRGIELFNQGDTKAAIRVLNAAVETDKYDADAWYYLGLALTRDNQISKARSAFEKAVKLRPDFAPAHVALSNSLLLANKTAKAEDEISKALSLEPRNSNAHYLLGLIRLRSGSCVEATNEAKAALNSTPNFGLAYLLRSQSRLCVIVDTLSKTFVFNRKVFRTAVTDVKPSRETSLSSARKAAQEFEQVANDLEEFLRLEPDTEDAAIWRTQLENLRIHAEPVTKNESERTIFLWPEVTTKVQVVEKPEPTYTQAAKEAQVIGTVLLRAVFSADGKVRNILVLNSLPKGLTQQAINAAQQIRFIPAVKDGHPVSVFMQLEYNFNLY